MKTNTIHGQKREVPLREAATASALLALLFVVVYNFTNWVTSQRQDVGTLVFSWERQIPFIPLMIAPYMSLDLFYLAAPFFCRRKAELKALERGIATAILAAGTCFLLFPLRAIFERKPVDGWLGTIFDNFRAVDFPHNLVPSLHIALALILYRHYRRHSGGAARAFVAAWFALIIASALFTHQHHVADIVGGYILGLFCLRLFPFPVARADRTTNYSVGARYLAGSAALAAAAAAVGGWAIAMLWPAASLLLVAAGYFGAGPAVYGKRDGKLDWTAWVLLWPVLAGHWISLWYYSRRCRAWNEVGGNLLVGKLLTRKEASCAREAGITAVLDLTSEFTETGELRALDYLSLPVLDLTAPTAQQLREAVSFISGATGKGKVLVHCKIGYSRSAAVAGAYLLSRGLASSVTEVERMLRSARPEIVMRPEVFECLEGHLAAVAPATANSGKRTVI